MWLERFRRFWTQHLDALGTEVARGKRERREQVDTTNGTPADGHPTAQDEEET